MKTEITVNTNDDSALRLNKYLSLHCECSRREADRLIASGRVKVDGAQAVQGMKIRSGQAVEVDGKAVEEKAGKGWILLAVNKPAGYVCSSDRRWGDPLLEDLLPAGHRLFPLGRLDKRSEGLILVTDRGDIVNPIMKGSARHEKEYIVRVRERITSVFLKQMREGVFLEELQVKTRPCTIRQLDGYTFSIVLTQGLNRQIRRMCAACGRQVVSLKRIRIMNIELGTLESGRFREITGKERQKLLENAGLSDI